MCTPSRAFILIHCLIHLFYSMVQNLLAMVNQTASYIFSPFGIKRFYYCMTSIEITSRNTKYLQNLFLDIKILLFAIACPKTQTTA